MGNIKLQTFLVFILLVVTYSSSSAQNYRDQIELYRLNDKQTLIYGNVKDYTGKKLSAATISIFDLKALVTRETIPIDGLGDYLFTINKGETVAFLIEKSGYFPYYHEYLVPEDADDQLEYNLQLPDGIRKDYTLIYPPTGFIPSNSALMEELISLLISQDELSLWMPDQENDLGKSRIDFLDSLLQVRGIEGYRLLSGSLPGETDHVIVLNFTNDDSAEIISAQDYGSTNGELANEKWTLQFAASKNKLSESDLKGLDQVKIYTGKDGYHRYTYAVFSSRQEANKAIPTLRKKGFSQAFPKQIGNLKKL